MFRLGNQGLCSAFVALSLFLWSCGGGESVSGEDSIASSDIFEPGQGPVFVDSSASSRSGNVGADLLESDATGMDASGSESSDNDPSGSLPPLAPASEVSPECIDGQYTETLPDIDASIDDLVASYSPAAVNDFILGILNRRYPVGAALIEGGLAGKDSGFGLGDCIEQFLYNKATPQQVISSLSTLVHECGHFYDLSLGGFAGAAYVITPGLQFTCQGGSIPAYGGKTFARSLILGDEYAALHKPCESFRAKDCEDNYAPVYLDGDPENGTFESGDQGFDMVLEEVVQYVNSLVTDYAFSEYVGGSISARDGILTFLWYMQRYLRMARLDYPATYTHLSGDPCWRGAILTAWGRAWLYLALTEGMSSLGIDDAKLIGLVRDPELLGEIERIRDAEGCP